jgi:hypothetical protein
MWNLLHVRQSPKRHLLSRFQSSSGSHFEVTLAIPICPLATFHHQSPTNFPAQIFLDCSLMSFHSSLVWLWTSQLAFLCALKPFTQDLWTWPWSFTAETFPGPALLQDHRQPHPACFAAVGLLQPGYSKMGEIGDQPVKKSGIFP